MSRKRRFAIAAALCAAAVFLFFIFVKFHAPKQEKYINKSGNTISTRFKVPEGYERVKTEEGSFEYYLQNLPLKKYGSKAYHYNGKINRNAPVYGVFDNEITPKNLEQCADAVMRLWAEYLYYRGEYDRIKFNFVNGFECDYVSYAEGNRLHVDDKICYWYKDAEEDYSYETFRRYMDLVHNYANTTSLQKQAEPVSYEDIRIGDIFVMTASQMNKSLGHAVIVVDMCVNKETGEKLLLIAESTTPASETYVVTDREGNVWIRLDEFGALHTSTWSCPGEFLRRLK